jgi:hypothetical protein
VNTVQFSPDLLTPFGDPQSVMADGTGSFQFEDTTTLNLAKRFYRLAYP